MNRAQPKAVTKAKQRKLLDGHNTDEETYGDIFLLKTKTALFKSYFVNESAVPDYIADEVVASAAPPEWIQGSEKSQSASSSFAPSTSTSTGKLWNLLAEFIPYFIFCISR